MFGLFKKKPLFNKEESHTIVEAIRKAEQRTSGEIRVFVERRCSWVDALDRAAELFFSLQMEKTRERNAVLVYVAIKDHQLAVFGDEGIHRKVGSEYWNKVVREMLQDFEMDQCAQAMASCVIQIGEALQTHFPYDKETDKNELPDNITFGR